MRGKRRRHWQHALMSLSATWRVRGKLLWRNWDHDFVVYDDASARTHQLDETTACALLLIEESPISHEALARRMASQLGCPLEEVEVHMPGILRQLRLVDLVETCPA